jgi:hypothetical protein
MTPEEINAAAERVRRVNNGERGKVVYGFAKTAGDPIEHDDYDHIQSILNRDRKVLAEAYLAQHSPELELPVDDAWLRSVGFTDELPAPIREEVYDGTMLLIVKIPDPEYEGGDYGQYVLVFDDMSGSIWLVNNGQCYGGSTIIRKTTTRRQVIQLLEALGLNPKTPNESE